MTIETFNTLIFFGILLFTFLSIIVFTEWASFKRGWIRSFRSIGFWWFRVPYLLVKGLLFSHREIFGGAPLMYVREELAKRRVQAVKEKLGEGVFDTAFLASFDGHNRRRNREAFETPRQADMIAPPFQRDFIHFHHALNADASIPSLAPTNQRQVMMEMMTRDHQAYVEREMNNSALNVNDTGQAGQAGQAGQVGQVNGNNPVNPVTNLQKKSPVVPTILNIEATKEEMEALGKAEEADFTV